MSKRYFFIFTVSTFILTVVWIISNIYHSYATSTIDSVLESQIQPIPGSFDKAIITDLKSRRVIEPDTSGVETLSPTPTEEEVQSSTIPEPQISQTQEDSQAITPEITPGQADIGGIPEGTEDQP